MFKIIYIVSILFLLNCGDDNSAVIETLDGDKLTVKKFETAYETAIESMSRMQNIEKENLIKIISKERDEINDNDQFSRQIYEQFQKKNFYDNYRNMLMVKKAADKAGFTSRPEIKSIVGFLEMQTISQLYITEQIEKKIKITDEEASNKCKELREKDAQLKNLPLDKCVQYGRGYIKAEQTRENLPKIYERVKEGIAIKHNEKFDLDQYFKSGVPDNLKEKKEAPTPEKK